MTTKTLFATTLALLLAACGASPASTGGRVSIQADLSGFASQNYVVVSVEANPAGVSVELTYDAETGRFGGSMSLPAGPQTLTAQALSDINADGQLEVVGVGNAEANVTENQTAVVVLVLIDLTAPPPVPDHRPIITSAGVSNANPLPGETVSAWVSAVDVDEDPMTYLWTVTCNTGVVTIADPTAAATTFTVDAAATCAVRASVMANGKSVSANMAIQIGGVGLANVTITFVAPPSVDQVLISDQASGFSCGISRAGDEATCTDPLAMGALTDVYLALSPGGDGAETSLDACGGVVTLVETGPGFARYTWEAPQASGICMVTGAISRSGHADTLPVALLLQ